MNDHVALALLLTLLAGLSTGIGSLIAFVCRRTNRKFLYLALGCTVAGYLLQNAALEGLSARTVALLQCTCPVMTAAFSYFLLGETLSLAGLAGAGIILACVVAETVMKEEAPPEETSEK